MSHLHQRIRASFDFGGVGFQEFCEPATRPASHLFRCLEGSADCMIQLIPWTDRKHLRHQFFAMQAVAPDMIERGGGSIINMGSNSWFEAGGGFPAYATAKAAVHGLTRTMARDLGKHRIRVNAVVPGWIMTERQKTLWAKPEALAAHQARQCLPDLIDPVYVARMVLFLASDDAAMCTASSYMVEAGSI